ncbi:uncharacterized protein B0H18DRAFT_626133 [Fomitopsis serialis]|uniref:uncharacterized protein n=1 Tax=Fomitopsis serialis TaxID=139415 RepID=UPI002008E009|nr:uncharacterized protein B0H18DRAFT_626133 [Neoantrodia serialis]KAH9919716.1 hypothetical protein B0H18DRAFT_626133 [Neoantrodia serialis]
MFYVLAVLVIELSINWADESLLNAMYAYDTVSCECTRVDAELQLLCSLERNCVPAGSGLPSCGIRCGRTRCQHRTPYRRPHCNEQLLLRELTHANLTCSQRACSSCVRVDHGADSTWTNVSPKVI